MAKDAVTELEMGTMGTDAVTDLEMGTMGTDTVTDLDMGTMGTNAAAVLIDIPDDLVVIGLDGEPLTPKKVITQKREDYKTYKENLCKFLDATWVFIVSSAGVFGVVSTKTKIFDTSALIQTFLVIYICVAAFAVLVARILDQAHHFKGTKFCLAASLWAMLGFVFTGLLHLKLPGWEYLICVVTLLLGISVGFYLWKVEKCYYLELIEGRAEKQFYESLRKRYKDQDTKVEGDTKDSLLGFYKRLMTKDSPKIEGNHPKLL